MGHVTWSRPEFFSIKNKRKYVFPASVSRMVDPFILRILV